MAYAQLIGLPPVFGLYVLLLPLVAYAVLGSSRQVIIGPEAGISGMLGAALVGLGGGDPTRLVALASFTASMVGAFFLVARLARLGWLADYFSRAVLVGYLHGIVFVLVVGQLGKLVGIPAGAKNAIPQLAYFVTHLGDIELASLVVGVSSVAAVLLLKRFLPRRPGALIVVVVGIIISAAVDLEAHGVAVVGPIPSGLPAVKIPSVSGTDVRHLLPVALGVFLVSFCDSILTARLFAGRHNQNVDANQELTALGVANLVSGMTQGFTPSASGSRTTVNDQMGARTQIAGFISVVLVAVVLLFLTEPMQYLPTPLLAALIVTAALGIVDPAAWRSLAASGRVPVAIAAITTIGVIVFGILPALGVAVALSIIEIVARWSTSARRRARLCPADRPLRRRSVSQERRRHPGRGRLPAGRPHLLRKHRVRDRPHQRSDRRCPDHDARRGARRGTGPRYRRDSRTGAAAADPRAARSAASNSWWRGRVAGSSTT